MLLLFAMAHGAYGFTAAHHDKIERAIYERMEAARAAICDIWQPSCRLLADYTKAQTCYVKFHLYRTPNRDTDLAQVERDLGKVEMAQAGRR